jgi:alpha-ketoglutarate-dependent taurine dioxygenase
MYAQLCTRLASSIVESGAVELSALCPVGGLLVGSGVQVHSLSEKDALSLRRTFVASNAGVLLARAQRLQGPGDLQLAARSVSSATRCGEVQGYIQKGRRGTPLENLPRGSDFWHQDKAFTDSPARFTGLYATKVPTGEGDTEFADLVSAWASFDERKKDELRTFHGWYNKFYNNGADYAICHTDPVSGKPIEQVRRDSDSPSQRHPIIRRHPSTGVEAPLLSPCYLEDVEPSKGGSASVANALVKELLEHSLQPQYTFRHTWRPGDILFWDNFIVMHRACTIDMSAEADRVMFRMEFED